METDLNWRACAECDRTDVLYCRVYIPSAIHSLSAGLGGSWQRHGSARHGRYSTGIDVLSGSAGIWWDDAQVTDLCAGLVSVYRVLLLLLFIKPHIALCTQSAAPLLTHVPSSLAHHHQWWRNATLSSTTYCRHQRASERASERGQQSSCSASVSVSVMIRQQVLAIADASAHTHTCNIIELCHATHTTSVLQRQFNQTTMSALPLLTQLNCTACGILWFYAHTIWYW